MLLLGAAHTCASSSDGKLYCWGHPTYGALGNGRLAVDPCWFYSDDNSMFIILLCIPWNDAGMSDADLGSLPTYSPAEISVSAGAKVIGPR